MTALGKCEERPLDYTAAVTHGMCDECRREFERFFVRDDDDADVVRRCEKCEQRIVEAVLGAASTEDLIRRLCDLGLTVQIGGAIEFPDCATLRFHYAIQRNSAILRPILVMVALRGTDALIWEFWDTWRARGLLSRRIQSYTADQAKKLLVMPMEAHLLRNCRGEQK